MPDSSESEAFDADSVAAFETLAGEFAESAGGDLTSLLGCAVSLGAAAVEVVEEEQAAEQPGPIVHLSGHAGAASQAVHMVLDAADAIAVAGLQVGQEAAEIEEARKGEIGDEQLAAFGGAMKLVTAVLGRLAEEHVGLGDYEPGKPSAVADPGAGWLRGGPFLRMGFALTLEGFEPGRLQVLVAAPGGEGAASNQTPAMGDGPLLLIDPDEATREKIVDVADALGREIEAVDPSKLPGLEDEAFQNAVGVIVAWDLGGHSGLELVEALRQTPSGRKKPVLLASPVPTRGMVEAALRAGASGFLLKPYTAEEMRDRGLA